MQTPIRARTFALIYLAMIPLYGVIFARLPSNFYHSTVRYEASIKRDADEIKREITSALITGIRNYYGSDIIKTESGNISADSLTVWKMEVKEGKLTFNIFCEENFGRAYNFPVSLWLEATAVSSLRRGGTFLVVSEQDAVQKGGLRLVDVCPGRSGPIIGYSRNDVEGHLVLEGASARRIQAYIGAQEGFPSTASGNLGRMLYFSAMTITTVGYGDIVPISSLARSLVASEAVLGVVIIGFFLNAVARRAERGSADGD
jgi:Ion channel